MSAVIGRVLLAVGIGVAYAVVYTFFKERREQHSHHTGRGGRGRTSYEDPDYNRPSWEEPPDEEDDRRSFRRRSSKSNGTKSEMKDENNKEPTSIVASCPICLDSFQELKRKEIAIYSTPCGHLFCLNCLKQAVKSSKVCPSCRLEIPFSRCHRIFM